MGSAFSMGSVFSYVITVTISYLIGNFGSKIIWTNKKPDGTPKMPWAPSPKGLPRFTNAYSIFDKEGYHALTRWSKEVGELFSVKIGWRQLTVLNSAELVYEALIVKEQLNSSKLPSDTQEKMTTDHCKTVYTAPFATYWARLRRAIYIVVGQLYVSQFVQQFVSQAQKLSFGINESIKEKDGKLTPKQLRALVDLVAMDTALTLTVGGGQDAVPRDAESMLTLISKCKELEDLQTRKNNRIGQFFSSFNSALDVATLFTWDRTMMNTRNSMLEIIFPWFEPIYVKKRESGAVTQEGDETVAITGDDKLDAIAKSLLNIEPSKNDPEPVQLTKAEVMVNLVHITLHAYTYLASTIFTLIQRLATKPQLQARLSQLDGEEKKALAKAFVRESFRVDTPNRLLAYAPRTDYDFSYKDQLYRIDEGTDLVINIDAIHTNPNYYPNPEKFNPDRFLKSEKKQTSLLKFGQEKGKTAVKDHLAFGAGRRVCLGAAASEELLVAVLYQLVEKYELKGGDVDEKIEINTSVWSWTGRTETKGTQVEFIKKKN